MTKKQVHIISLLYALENEFGKEYVRKTILDYLGVKANEKN